MPSVEMLVLHLLDFECIRLAIGGLASRSHHFSCRSAGGAAPRRIPLLFVVWRAAFCQQRNISHICRRSIASIYLHVL